MPSRVVGRCEDCGHWHRGGYCAEVCTRCQEEILRDCDDYDPDELGEDPEERYDYE